MDMKQCANGHYYDSGKTPNCPYCNSAGEYGVTRPLTSDAGPANLKADFPKTAPLATPMASSDIGKTVALNVNEQGYDPIRGWIVCVEGRKKGKDFGIHSDKNFIGRSKGNDICIDFDDAISRENHAIITYDQKKNKFWFQSGDGRSNVYLNNEIVLVPAELNAYDTMLMGATKFIFVPFCSDKFSW